MIFLYLILLLLAMRYIPGLKCVSYCRYRKYRYERAVLKLMSYFINEGFKDLSKKEMIYLYEQSIPFGCTSLIKLQNQDKAREILKNMIVEKELLED